MHGTVTKLGCLGDCRAKAGNHSTNIEVPFQAIVTPVELEHFFANGVTLEHPLQTLMLYRETRF